VRQVIGGVEKVVHLNGAIECVNPRCPSRTIKYTTRGRDANAAADIALSGASIVLAADHQPLPCYRCNSKHSRYNLATSLFYSRDTRTVHHDSIQED
jgi:hypothetical protein